MQRTLIALAAGVLIATPAIAENYDVHFKGGTAKEYYTALQESIPGIRLVVHPDVDYFTMPPVDLPDTSAWAAVVAGAVLLDGIDAELIPGGDSDGDSHATFVITADRGAVERELRSHRTIDLDFSGGSLEKLVWLLRDTSDANIVLQPEAAGIPIPPMQLKQATVWNVLRTLDSNPISERDFEVSSLSSDLGKPLYYLRSLVPQPEQHNVLPERTRVFSIAEMLQLGTVDAQALIAAIDIAAEIAEEEITVRYHKGTELLIVRGTPDAIVLVGQVVQEAYESALQRTRKH